MGVVFNCLLNVSGNFLALLLPIRAFGYILGIKNVLRPLWQTNERQIRRLIR